MTEARPTYEELLARVEALQESERRYRSIVDNSLDAILLTTPDGGILEANPAACRMFGRSPEELRQGGRACLSDASDPSVKAALEERSRAGRAGAEMTLVRADGTRFPAEVTSTIFIDADGRRRTSMIVRDITERKRAEEALHTGEENYRNLFENAIMGISQALPDGRLVKVNEAYARMYGYSSPAEILAHVDNVNQLYANPDDRQEVLRIVSEKGVMEPKEIPVIRRDGSRFVVLVSARAIRDASGTLVCFQAEHVDITELKQAEESLRQSELRYRTLLDASFDLIYVIGRDDTVEYVNSAALKMLRCEEEEVLGKPRATLFSPGMAATQGQALARVFATGEPMHQEHPSVTEDGVGYQETQLFPLKNLDGEVRSVLGMSRDITARKRAEDGLRNSRAFLDNVINAIADPVFVKDEARRFVLVNDALCKIVGRPREGLLGQDGDDMFPEDEVAVFRKMDAAVLGTGNENVNEEYLSNLSTKEVSTIVTRKTRYVDPTGKRFLVGVIRDITELKRLQSSLAQADRLASMGMLAAGVAHEINNPLSYVLYNVESLAQDLPKLADAAKRCGTALRERVGDAALDEILGDGAEILRPAPLDDAVDRVREALEGTHRIKDVARGLATFSRVEQVEQSAVDVRHAVETAVHMAMNEIRFRAQLVRDLEPVPTVMASEGKLSQVFLNLLINAAHAIDEGDVGNNRIAVRTRTDGADVLVEISDTGKGIPPGDLDRVFEPFYSTKGVGKGSGLGLAICHNLVVELGGEIRVESEVGRGTRFVVRLPVRRDEPREERTAAVSERPQPASGRGRILVVDDEESVRKTMIRLFGQAHEVVCAGSGQAAQAILARDASFDVILCDLMMPEMTGMDLHAWLAARDPALAARIVFITGGAFTPRASEYLAHAGNIKVDKPFDPANLRKLVSKLIGDGKSGA
jgi:two-component system, cell cycle sensor histidine kinase and response regulator CckA